MVLESGASRARPVSVCGAMASNPIAAVLLVGMGLRELSMEASAIPLVKEAIGRITLAELEEVVKSALRLVTAREIEQHVTAAFGPRLADLLGDE